MSGNKRIGGKDLDFMLGDLMIHAESFSLSISDGTTATKTRGITNGYVDGETSADGDIEVDSTNLNLIIEAARKAGSFKELEPFDIVSNAETASEKFNLEAFGCKLMLSDVLNADPKGGDKLKHKIKYIVTSKDFVRINGVPYLSKRETESLL